MFKKIKSCIKNNDKLYKKSQIIYYYFIPNIIYYIRRINRRYFKGNNIYKKMLPYKDKHLGQRCFILATGPSLTFTDIEKLNNEISFSMNSIVLAFNKTEWRPTYYGIQDPFVYKKIEKKILNDDTMEMFFGDRLYRLFNIPSNVTVFPHNLLNHKINHNFGTKFSDNVYLDVYDGYTITYSLIQIAVYMGFKEIYLLGCDCNYSNDKNKQHFVESGHYDPTYKTAGERMTVAYMEAQRYADSHGIKIYNATRGGMLEVFPRIDLDEVLGIKEKK